jgi:hypothetical protein
MENNRVQIITEFSELQGRQGTLTGNSVGILREVDFGFGTKGMFTKTEFMFVEDNKHEDKETGSEEEAETEREIGFEFYDTQVKRKFFSSKFKITNTNGKTFAVSKSEYGDYNVHRRLTAKEIKELK